MLINTLQPGVGIDQAVIDQAMSDIDPQELAQKKEQSAWVTKSLWPGIVKSTIPKNIIEAFSATNMLAVIFVSIVFGIGIIYLKDEKAIGVLQSGLSGISDITIMIVGFVMKFAPVAVGALIAVAVYRFGYDIMKYVLMYVLVVLTGYLIQFFVVYGALLKYVIKVSPAEFYKRASTIFFNCI